MSQPYLVGGTAACTGAAAERASPAARAWLASLQAVTASQDFFVTPYADVDVAALTHAGLSTDLAQAYATGLRVTQDQLRLGVTQRAAGVSGQIAWPADGIADYAVLGNLAAHGVGTVILGSSMMPPSSPAQLTPSAITTTPDGVNAGLHVALADSTLTQVLSRPGGHGRPVRWRPRGRRDRRHRPALPGRDRDDGRRAAVGTAVRGHRAATAVESGPRPGQRAAHGHRHRALAAPGEPGRPADRPARGRPGGPAGSARPADQPGGAAPAAAAPGQGPGVGDPDAGQHAGQASGQLPGRRGGGHRVLRLAG